MPYSKETVTKYLLSLTKLENIAMTIAKKDLGTSFNIVKSVGFITWLRKNKV